MTSHRSQRELGLSRGAAATDTQCMEVATIPIYRRICAECHLPALTFDREDTPLCAGHATEFIGVEKPEIVDEDEW